MRPSVNYDHLIHGDHVHWCNVEALGVSRCGAQAMREHEETPIKVPLADVGLSMMIAMGITLLAGMMWGMERGRAARSAVPLEHAFSAPAVERV
ncbi:MAG: hypothetical protein V2I43_14475 [Parvularcula sp.]|jgi:hypothetical protein|nr:hypothetical protein [Parvularcula sp.]